MFQKLKKVGSTALAFLVAAGMFPAGSMITSAADTADSDAVFYVTEAACAHSEDKTILKSYTKEKLQELAEENTEPAAYMYFKSGINVVGVTEYVTFEQLLGDIDWAQYQKDGKTFAYLSSDNFSYDAGYDILDASSKENYCFFPKLTADGSNTDGGYAVPACVALKWGLDKAESGTETTAGELAEKIFASASEESLRGCIGSLEEDVANSSGTTAGNRLVSDVCELSFVSPSELVHHDAVEATKTGSGNIEYWECSVCHKKFSDAKAKNPVSDEDIIIPADKVALTITEADCTHQDGQTLYTYYYSDLQKMAEENTEPQGYLHIKNETTITAYGVTEYVTLEQLLTNAGVDWEEYMNNGSQFSLIASDGFVTTQSYDLLDSGKQENYKFYPNITLTGKDLAESYSVPACISLAYGSVSLEGEMTSGEALETACDNAKEGIRAFSGSLEEDAQAGGNQGTVAGNRLASNVNTISFVKSSGLVKHEAKDATTDADGNIEYYECPECGKMFDSAKGTNELTEEQVIIPKLETEPGQPGNEGQQKVDLSKATVTVANASKQVYTGKALTPAVTVTVNGKTVPASEYTVDYKDNTNAGTATVTVAAKPTSTSYTGTTKATFKIAKAAQTIKLASASKTLKVKKLKKNKLTKKETFTFTVKNAKTKLNVTCKDKKVTAKVSGKKVTVTVKKGAKKGNYTLKVNAKETANYKASAVKKFKLKVKKAA